MLESWSREKRIFLFALVVAILLFSFLALFVNKGEKVLADADAVVEVPSEEPKISFFEMDRYSVLTRKLRNQLKKRLGPDRLETWRPFELEVLPESVGRVSGAGSLLSELSDAAFKELSGRHVLELSYRYAEKRGIPFSEIRLVFSGFDKKPLLVELFPRGDGKEAVAHIERRFGKMRDVVTTEDGILVRRWSDAGDLVLAARVKDRYGNPQERMAVIFSKNLATFVDTLKKGAPESEPDTGF